MDRNKVKSRIFEFLEENWSTLFPHSEFHPGTSFIQYSGAVFDHKEISAAIDVLLDGWFGVGRKARQFERELADYLTAQFSVVVNSGSSANLLAISALKSHNLENNLKSGDRILTAASGFPTTINPIIQNTFVPSFVDIELGSYNLDLAKIEEALSSETKAIFVVHTLGNPVDMARVNEIARKDDLWVIEDCCDALGSEIHGRKVGSYGDMSTYSFYPAHHITMGEGGAVATSNETLLRILRSLREWGRDCHCYGKETVSLKNGLCRKRFSKWLPDLDAVVDHKYVYSEIGYNLKPLELQCAIGLEQLKKLPDIISARNHNFESYYELFKDYEDYFILPSWHSDSNPSWFGFPLTVRHSAPFDRSTIVGYIESHRIQTRPLFAGNILYHPAYRRIKYERCGELTNTNMVTTNTFFLGVYPGIDETRMDFILDKLQSFLKEF